MTSIQFLPSDAIQYADQTFGFMNIEIESTVLNSSAISFFLNDSAFSLSEKQLISITPPKISVANRVSKRLVARRDTAAPLASALK